MFSDSGSDNKIFVWNVGTGEAIMELEFPDIPLSASWSWDGSKFATSCKDRKVRIVDGRTGRILRVHFFLSRMTILNYFSFHNILCIVNLIKIAKVSSELFLKINLSIYLLYLIYYLQNSYKFTKLCTVTLHTSIHENIQ